MHLLRKIIWAS